MWWSFGLVLNVNTNTAEFYKIGQTGVALCGETPKHCFKIQVLGKSIEVYLDYLNFFESTGNAIHFIEPSFFITYSHTFERICGNCVRTITLFYLSDFSNTACIWVYMVISKSSNTRMLYHTACSKGALKMWELYFTIGCEGEETIWKGVWERIPDLVGSVFNLFPHYISCSDSPRSWDLWIQKEAYLRKLDILYAPIFLFAFHFLTQDGSKILQTPFLKSIK